MSSERTDEPDIPDDAFLMVTQEHWENKILTDVPYTPSPAYTGVGGAWRPMSETPFPRQLSSPELASASASDPGLVKSLFPVENYDLVYGQWEDNIIRDSDAVEQLPTPSLPQIDPNDPNFIIGIPEEPAPIVPLDKEARKVCHCVTDSSGFMVCVI